MRARRCRASMVALLLTVALLGPAAVTAQEASPVADLDANRRLVAQVYESFTAGELDALDAIVASDLVDHFPLIPGQAPGWEGLKASFAGLLAAFPDIVCQAEEIVAEGDGVAVLEFCRGTHQGEFLGIPPTGRSIAVRSTDVWRVEDGQLAEVWNLIDLLTLLTQLGVVAGMPASASTDAAATPTTSGSLVAATPPSASTLDANKEVSRRFIDAFAAPDLATLDQLLAPDLVNHAAPSGLPPTREGLVQVAQAFEAGIPNYRVVVEDQIAEGNLVATRATVSGTHTGTFLGIPPTGRTFVAPAVFFDRIDDGRVVETWEVYDSVGILIQIGVVPPPGAAPAGTPAT